MREGDDKIYVLFGRDTRGSTTCSSFTTLRIGAAEVCLDCEGTLWSRGSGLRLCRDMGYHKESRVLGLLLHHIKAKINRPGATLSA